VDSIKWNDGEVLNVDAFINGGSRTVGLKVYGWPIFQAPVFRDILFKYTLAMNIPEQIKN
jgi:hypothetical protein